ncbi:MAG: hypothetical protein V1704_02440 [Candidatus Vogelbacteria bacterium]
MNIPEADIELFFKLHPALLQFVNQRLRIFPNIKTAKDLKVSGVENVNQVRTELWGRMELISDFISENPVNLSENELAIVASWKHFIKGKFYILRHLKKYSIFLTEAGPTKAYGVCSLNTPLRLRKYFGSCQFTPKPSLFLSMIELFMTAFYIPIWQLSVLVFVLI